MCARACVCVCVCACVRVCVRARARALVCVCVFKLNRERERERRTLQLQENLSVDGSAPSGGNPQSIRTSGVEPSTAPGALSTFVRMARAPRNLHFSPPTGKLCWSYAYRH